METVSVFTTNAVAGLDARGTFGWMPSWWRELRVGLILWYAVCIEVLAVLCLVTIVAVLGPSEPKAVAEFAARAGMWVGPSASAVLCFLFARRLTGYMTLVPKRVAHGLALGVAAALADILILVVTRTPFELMFVFSAILRVFAAWLGARYARR